MHSLGRGCFGHGAAKRQWNESRTNGKWGSNIKYLFRFSVMFDG